jgi:hypothetical protein
MQFIVRTVYKVNNPYLSNSPLVASRVPSMHPYALILSMVKLGQQYQTKHKGVLEGNFGY